MSNTFVLNNGYALRVVVRPVALSSPTCTRVEVLASKGGNQIQALKQMNATRRKFCALHTHHSLLS